MLEVCNCDFNKSFLASKPFFSRLLKFVSRERELFKFSLTMFTAAAALYKFIYALVVLNITSSLLLSASDAAAFTRYFEDSMPYLILPPAYKGSDKFAMPYAAEEIFGVLPLLPAESLPVFKLTSSFIYI